MEKVFNLMIGFAGVNGSGLLPASLIFQLAGQVLFLLAELTTPPAAPLLEKRRGVGLAKAICS
ncbi:hypothetical protein [Pontibacter arcticus]|nr:hypothetical protein [Pontibacter arcticus]